MIEITTTINAPVSTVWSMWNDPKGIEHWAFAADDWAAEGIENDVQPGGTFKNRNFAKDGSMEFMFSGTYDEVTPESYLFYTLEDGRKVEVRFIEQDENTVIEQQFDPEDENPAEMQQQGWQKYLDNFKKYVESTQ